MKSSKMDIAKYWFNTELHDGYGSAGGTGSAHETLLDHLLETEDSRDYGIDQDAEHEEEFIKALGEIEMYEVNNSLVDCGIAPVLYDFEEERKQLAALIALYVGEMSVGKDLNNDSISIMKMITDFADNVDLDIIEEDGEYLIDTEAMREQAQKFASELIEKLKKKAA